MNQINSTIKNVLGIFFFAFILNLIVLISSSYPWAFFARETTDTSKNLLKADTIRQINWDEQIKKISSQIPNRNNRPMKDDYRPDELVIKYKKNVGTDKISLKELKESLQVTRISKHLGFRVVKIPKGKTVKELIAQFSKDPDVEYAEPNYNVYVTYFPDDQYLNDKNTTLGGGWYAPTGEVPTWTDPSTGQLFTYYTYLPYTLYGLRLPSLPQNYTGYISDSGAWEITRGASRVKVAVIDTGVMGNHEDLLGQVGRGFDYVNNDGMPLDDFGHGTHVAGIIAANADNFRGVCGFAPEVTIVPIKVLSGNGSGSSADVAEGIIGSVKDYHANILNLSLGGYGDAQVMREAVQEALAEGAIIVAAAGNDGVDITATPFYPASYPRVITVGSFNYRGTFNYVMQTTGTGTPIPTQYSNYGYVTGRTNSTDSGVEIYAPGGDPELYLVYSTVPYNLGGTKYAAMMGTSMAAPQVAGLCALLYAKGVGSPDAITYALWSSSMSPYPPYAHGSSTFDFGYGIIDPRAALSYKLASTLGYFDNSIDDDMVDGTFGNGNHILNPGETVDLSVFLVNNGSFEISDVVGQLTSDDPYVTISTTYQEQAYGTMPAGIQKSAAQPFRFTVKPNVINGYEIRFKLLVRAAGTSWTQSEPLLIVFDLMVYNHGPVQFYQINVVDSVAPQDNSDSLIEVVLYGNPLVPTGETVDLYPVLRNYGGDTVYGVRAVLSNYPPNEYYASQQFGSYLSQWFQTVMNPLFGDIPPLSIATAQSGLRFTVRSDAPDNTVVPMYLYIYDAEGNSWVDMFSITIYHDFSGVEEYINYKYSNLRDYLIDDPLIGDPDNNGDEIINPGETFRLRVTVQNCTPASPVSVSGQLRINQTLTRQYNRDYNASYVQVVDDGPYGTMPSPFSSLATMPATDPFDPENRDYFYVTVSPACPPDYHVFFDLDLLGQHTCTFMKNVYLTRSADARSFYPNFNEWFLYNDHPMCIVDMLNINSSYKSYSTYRGNLDSMPNPGETVKLILTLYNKSWDVGLQGIVAQITTTNPNDSKYIHITKPTMYYESLLPRGILPGSPNPATINTYAGLDTSTSAQPNYFEFYIDPTCLDTTDIATISADTHYANRHHDISFDLYMRDTLGRVFFDNFVVQVVKDSYNEFLNGTNGGYSFGGFFDFELLSPPYANQALIGYPPQVIGFPYTIATAYGSYTSGYIKNSVAVGDINLDGKDEIIIATGIEGTGIGYLYVLSATGTVLWSRQIENYLVNSSPALADFNNDGKVESIIIGSGLSTDTNGGRVYAYDAAGNLISGWNNATTSRLINTTPVVVDIDNNKSAPEVLIGTKAFGSNGGILYCFNTNGTVRWKKQLGAYIDFSSTPAVADLDRDGKLDIIVGCTSTGRDGQILRFAYDGATVWSKNFPGEPIFSSIALGDVDWDGKIEMAFGTNTTPGKVYLLTPTGTNFPGWPKATVGPIATSPAIGDLDGDLYPEIIVGGTDGTVYVWNYPALGFDPNARTWQLWFTYSAPRDPVGTQFDSPSIADVNNDGKKEIVITADNYYDSAYDYLYLYPRTEEFGYHYDVHVISAPTTTYANNTGTECEGYPAPTMGALFGSPTFCDLDRNGKFNIVLGDLNHNVYVWDLPDLYDSNAIDWNGFHGNMQRTGLYDSLRKSVLLGIRYSHYILDTTSDDNFGASSGNGDGQVNQGETIEMGLAIKNFTMYPASNVYAMISSADVSLAINTVRFAGLNSFAVGTSTTRFVFSVPDVYPKAQITFYANIYATITGVNYSWQTTFLVPVVGGTFGLEFNSYQIDDQTPPSIGNANRLLNPGETVLLYVNLQYIGSQPINGVVAQLLSNDPAVTGIAQSIANYGNFVTGTINLSQPPYMFSINSSVPSGYEIPFTLLAYDSQSSFWVIPFTIPIGATGQSVWHLYYHDTSGNAFHVIDTTGNSNTFAEPGETVDLPMILYNSGNTLTNVIGQMTTAYGPPGNPLTIIDNFERYRSDSTSFNVYVLSSTEYAYRVAISSTAHPRYYHTIYEWEISGIDVDTVSHVWLDRLGLTVATSGLVCYALDSIDDDNLGGSFGNGNGVVDPGESIQLIMGIQNNSLYTTTNVIVQLTAVDSAYVTVTDPLSYYGSINSTSIKFNPSDTFTFRVSQSIPENAVLNFNLSIQYTINTAAIPWALDSAEVYPEQYTFSTTLPYKLYMGTLIYYELPNRTYSAKINDTFNTFSTRGNNNGVINPGETVELTFSLWNRDKNVGLTYTQGTLVPADSYTQQYIKMLDSTAFFGYASPRSPVTTQTTGGTFKFYVDPSIQTDPSFSFASIKFDLYLYDSTSNKTRKNINLYFAVTTGVPPYVAGFPKYLGGFVKSSPTLADVNRNGSMDIVIGNAVSGNGYVFAFEYDTTASIPRLLYGWPRATGGEIFGSPAVADLNNDGNMEVVVGNMNGWIYVWDSTGQVLPGWPQNVHAPIQASCAVGDINKDGQMEIIAVSQVSSSIYAFTNTGTKLWEFRTGADINSTPALADLDKDFFGYLEIITGSDDNKIRVLSYDSTLLWEYPTGGIIESSPAVGDLDGNGTLDIVVGSYDGKVYAWNTAGNLLNNWPVTVNGPVLSSPALGDLNNDLLPDIVIGTLYGYVYAWSCDSAGQPRQLWLVILPDAVSSSPAIGDINGDGSPEVLISCANGRIYAFNGETGLDLPGWIDGVLLSSNFKLESSPAIGDINTDGNVDITVGSDDGYLYSLNLLDAYDEGLMEWPMFHHDAQHTGLYTPPSGSPWQNLTWVTTDGTPTRLNFAYYGDIDWVAFRAEAGHIYRMAITNQGTGVSTIFYLYASDGKTILGYGYTELEKLINTPGIYYIKIINQWGNSGPTANYTISVSVITGITPELWKEY